MSLLKKLSVLSTGSPSLPGINPLLLPRDIALLTIPSPVLPVCPLWITFISKHTSSTHSIVKRSLSWHYNLPATTSPPRAKFTEPIFFTFFVCTNSIKKKKKRFYYGTVYTCCYNYANYSKTIPSGLHTSTPMGQPSVPTQLHLASVLTVALSFLLSTFSLLIL